MEPGPKQPEDDFDLPQRQVAEAESGQVDHQPASSAEKERRLARIAGGLAHEIKNPLSTMAINLALLEEEYKRAAEEEGNARAGRALKRVGALQREVGRLEGILEDFLRYARGGEVNRAPADLSELITDTLSFVESEDELNGIRHHVDLPPSLPLVLLDKGLFRQALLNLFVNARQAMVDGGELIVQAQRQGNYVEVTVTDTGVGMDDEAQSKCFDIYWSNKKQGTGLGLPTVRRIVEEHEGTIGVLSEPGRGTSISVVLPLAVEITAQVTQEEVQ
jgi:signal transduction histidine kinase